MVFTPKVSPLKALMVLYRKARQAAKTTTVASCMFSLKRTTCAATDAKSGGKADGFFGGLLGFDWGHSFDGFWGFSKSENEGCFHLTHCLGGDFDQNV